ncbi:MAG: hypothetical protein OXF02_05790 [Simkaniaceae bacterium]|nr:hypothetical protein [Simkaniaceae bacterium]
MSVSGLSHFLTDRLFGRFLAMYRSVHHESAPPLESLPSDRTTEPGGSPCLLESMKVDKRRLLDREGVREDVAFVRVRHRHLVSKQMVFFVGADAFRAGDAVVYLADDLYRTDRECAGFLVNREIKHILSNDAVTFGVVGGMNDLARPVMSGVGCFKAIRAFSRRGVAGIVSPFLGVVAGCFFCNRMVDALFRWRIAKAYDFAMAHATDEELKGGWRFFTVRRRLRMDEARTLRDLLAEDLSRPFGIWRRLITTSCPGGGYLCNFGCPSDTSRLHKVKRALAARRIEMDEEAEEQRVERLRICWVERAKLLLKQEAGETYLWHLYHMHYSMVPPGSADTSEEPRPR